MRYIVISFVLLALPFSFTAYSQGITNGDFSQGMDGWNVTPQAEAKASVAVVGDAWEGKPALKITVDYAPPSSWWMLKLLSAKNIKLEPGVSYTVKFSAKLEEGSRSVEMTIGEKRNSQKLKIFEDWQECAYSFTVEEATSTAFITIDNLAVNQTTYYFANFRLTKD